MKFEKGQSGNPTGRPRGSGPRAKLRDSLTKDVPEILAALVAQAKAGDVQAARTVLDRCLPSLRPVAAPVVVDLGQDLANAGAAVLVALSAGDIGTDQAHDLAGVLSALAKIKETTELESRIAALETKQ